MMLYLANTENIYSPQIKEYFREIISSYDNGNYRSAMVMLYSTIVCDLLLKLKELSDVYSDEKSERILEEINKQRRNANSSAWEWNLIKKIRDETEMLNDASYAILEHIYSLRNFSAHPALNEEYELISPSPEITVAYIKQALEDIFSKPAVFAQNIVDRMSDDVANRKEQYHSDIPAFRNYLNKVYFQRMPVKMANQVFKAFWKFTFQKVSGEPFESNRYVNRRVLEAMLENFNSAITKYFYDNPSLFSIANNDTCLMQACALFASYPTLFNSLSEETKYQIRVFGQETDVSLLKWFVCGNVKEHVDGLKIKNDTINQDCLRLFKEVCTQQGCPFLFVRFLIHHYSQSGTFVSAKDRYYNIIEPFLDLFTGEDFVALIQAINENNQIYNGFTQKSRNDQILEVGKSLLPVDFDLTRYEHFEYTKESMPDKNEFDTVDDEDLPF